MFLTANCNFVNKNGCTNDFFLNSNENRFSIFTVHQHCRQFIGCLEDIVLTSFNERQIFGQEGFSQWRCCCFNLNDERLRENLQKRRGQVHAEILVRSQRRVLNWRRWSEHLLPVGNIRNKLPPRASNRKLIWNTLRSRSQGKNWRWLQTNLSRM